MKYSKLYNHSLFEQNGRSFRKHSAAFAVDLKTGKDAIFDVNDEVTPISKQRASELSGLEMRYL